MIELNKIKKRILDISFKYKTSHLGSVFSTLPIILEIYNTSRSTEPFVLSSGHSALALYCVLENKFNIDADNLYCKFGTHPRYSVEDKIWCSTGSLGQGITVAVGYAISDPNRKVNVLISDGECAEGSVWESLKFIRDSGLNNINVYVNMNGYSAISTLDVDYLTNCLTTFLPSINIRRTTVEQFPFLIGLESHYKVMSESEYKLAVDSIIV